MKILTGENVFILPNNSNIILTAEQTKELSTRNVVVIPSKTIPQGIAALLAFDESKSLEENTDTMKEVNNLYKNRSSYLFC